MTPEGRVKRRVRQILEAQEGMWFDMPVPSGYGRQTVDFIGCFRGYFFAVETKAEGKELTLRQENTARGIASAMGVVFTIVGESPEQFEPLVKWLAKIDAWHPINDPHLPPAPTRRRPI